MFKFVRYLCFQLFFKEFVGIEIDCYIEISKNKFLHLFSHFSDISKVMMYDPHLTGYWYHKLIFNILICPYNAYGSDEFLEIWNLYNNVNYRYSSWMFLLNYINMAILIFYYYGLVNYMLNYFWFLSSKKSWVSMLNLILHLQPSLVVVGSDSMMVQVSLVFIKFIFNIWKVYFFIIDGSLEFWVLTWCLVGDQGSYSSFEDGDLKMFAW